MDVLRFKVSGLKSSITKLTSLTRRGFLVVSESPRVVLRIPQPPVIEFLDGMIIATFDGAKIEKIGKDLDLLKIEIDDRQVRLYTEWIFGVDANIVIELT